MTEICRLNIEALYRQLRRALRYGARASRLLRHTPDVIELLFPAAPHPHLSACDRAIKAETVIRQAADAIGGSPGHAIATVLCLPPGTLGRTLEDRRRIAARHLDLEADTWRRDWHEGALLYDLTIEIYRLHTTRRTVNTPETDTLNPV